MRTPVISRFVATAAATLTLGVALPLLTTDSASAAPCNTLSSLETSEHHAKSAVTEFIPVVPTSVTAGGAPVEVVVEQVNFTGEPYQKIAPTVGLFASEKSSVNDNWLAQLQPEHVTVEVMVHNAWKRVPMLHGCDPAILTDTSAIAEPLADGHAHRFMFRVSLSAKAPRELKKINVSTASGAHFTLDIVRQAPATPTTPAATPSPATPTATPTVAPAAVISTPSATPTATDASSTPAAAPQQELASTGPSHATRFLFVSGAAMLALGCAVLYGLRRLAKR